MIFADGRGKALTAYQINRRIKNVERVRDWLKINPGGRPKDCAMDLGLSNTTIYSIAKQLRSERAEDIKEHSNA